MQKNRPQCKIAAKVPEMRLALSDNHTFILHIVPENAILYTILYMIESVCRLARIGKEAEQR